jgi:hypothetical protein
MDEQIAARIRSLKSRFVARDQHRHQLLGTRSCSCLVALVQQNAHNKRRHAHVHADPQRLVQQ